MHKPRHRAPHRRQTIITTLLLAAALLLIGATTATTAAAASADDYWFLAKWGSSGSGDGEFHYPRGVAVDGGNIYVADTFNHRIQKFTTDGTFVAKWGSQGTANGQFYYPYGVAVAGGNIYVVDSDNHRIQKFTTDGSFVAKWGSQGSGDGQFNYPTEVAVAGANIYVADGSNHRIQKFARDTAAPTTTDDAPAGWSRADVTLTPTDDLSGVADLLPCLFALAALACYAKPKPEPDARRPLVSPVALVLFALAVLPYRENIALLAVLVLFEVLVEEKTGRRPARLIPFALVTIFAAYLHADLFHSSHLDPVRMFAPLYFIFYPIGFLPENAALFHEKAWVGYVAAGAVLVLIALIYRKARRPAILFGLLGMASVRLLQGDRLIDPVHLVGGGQLLLANALFNIAVSALWRRMSDHPKWSRPVITITTVICLVFFGLQIRADRAWARAGEVVKGFQEQTADWREANPGEPLGIVPDYQYHIGAPLCLSEAVRYDTLFSRAVPSQSLLPLHYVAEDGFAVTVSEWGSDRGQVRIKGKQPVDVVYYPYTFTHVGDTLDTEHTRLTLTHVDEDGFTVEILPKSGPLPRHITPPATDR